MQGRLAVRQVGLYGRECDLQIYSVVSLVEQRGPLLLYNNSFLRCAGTKGPLLITSTVTGSQIGIPLLLQNTR